VVEESPVHFHFNVFLEPSYYHVEEEDLKGASDKSKPPSLVSLLPEIIKK